MERLNNKARGSVTVEAAIALPIFISIVMSLAMLIKLVYIHETIQHAIDEAANELAAYSYIYHISDIEQINNTIQQNLEENSADAEEHIGTVIDACGSLESAYTTGSKLAGEVIVTASSPDSFISKADRIINQVGSIYKEGMQFSKESINSIDSFYEVFEEVRQDPKKEAASIAWLLTKGLYSDAKNLIAAPIIKYTVKGYLQKSEFEDADKSLRKLNIYNGFKGLDFYSSTLFQQGENVDIIVSYRVELPLPLKILPEIYMIQRSTARAWLKGGDGTSFEETSIWDLPNTVRGKKIEAMFGSNLDTFFPVIDIYERSTGSGTAIHSTDLNKKTYQSNEELYKLLMSYVNELKNQDVIVYKQKSYELKSKKIILVIPKDSINERNKLVIDQIVDYAKNNNIGITISEL